MTRHLLRWVNRYKGDSLGIIEAMKIMNPLEATQSGIIAEILVQNGDVVQFGQPIVRYES